MESLRKNETQDMVTLPDGSKPLETSGYAKEKQM